MLSLIENKILKKNIIVSVIGLGYTGLPLAILIARNNYKLIGYDNDKNKIKQIRDRRNVDHDKNELKNFLKLKNTKLTSNLSEIKKADILIICLPTPLDKNKQPDLKSIETFMKAYKKFFKKNQLIIFESTTYPGTTKKYIVDFINELGFSVGKNFFVGYSPERIDPGRKIDLSKINKIYSGYSSKCKKLIKIFYKKLFKNVFELENIESCELTKLFENIYRNINIGLVNEMKIISDKLNINFRNVLDAAETKSYGFKRFNPGPGIGGHCIPIDPFYLTWKMKEYDLHTRFIELSGEVNSQMPMWCVNKVKEHFLNKSLNFTKAKILILGLAYKKNVSDIRESPALKICEILKQTNDEIYFYDPHVKSCDFVKKNKIKFFDLNKRNIKFFDCVILCTDHDNMNYKKVLKEAKIIFDTRLKLTSNKVISI